MNNEHRFEISNRIISVDQIKEISNYLQKTCNYYIDLFQKDKEKNNNAYIDNATYQYYNVLKPEVKYDITFNDERHIQITDLYAFENELNEPQYLKDITIQLYISYRDNEFYEITEHEMSVYLTFTETSVYFSTSDKNMNEQSYNMNSYIRGILESGEERYAGVVKNKFFIKNIIGITAGSIFTLILFFVLLVLRNNGNEEIEFLFNNGIILTLLGWLLAFVIGTIFVRPIIDSLYKEIDSAHSVYSDMKDVYKKEYKKRNEVLIGSSYNNLEKRNIIRKIYSISKNVLLIRIGVSIIIVILLSVI